MVSFMGLKDRAKHLAQQAKEIGTDLQQRGATAVQHATEAVRGGRVDPSVLLSVEVITKATDEVTTRQPNDMQDGCTTAVWRGPTWRVWLNVYHPTAQEGGQATPEWATSGSPGCGRLGQSRCSSTGWTKPGGATIRLRSAFSFAAAVSWR